MLVTRIFIVIIIIKWRKLKWLVVVMRSRKRKLGSREDLTRLGTEEGLKWKPAEHMPTKHHREQCDWTSKCRWHSSTGERVTKSTVIWKVLLMCLLCLSHHAWLGESHILLQWQDAYFCAENLIDRFFSFFVLFFLFLHCFFIDHPKGSGRLSSVYNLMIVMDHVKN